MRVGLYVDGFNAYYGARAMCGHNKPGWRWLDLPRLAMDLVNPTRWPDAELARFAYCTAPRGRGRSRKSADQENYIAALKHAYPGAVVPLGSYVARTKIGILVNIDDPSSRVSPDAGPLPSWFPAHETRQNQGRLELLVSVSAFEERDRTSTWRHTCCSTFSMIRLMRRSSSRTTVIWRFPFRQRDNGSQSVP